MTMTDEQWGHGEEECPGQWRGNFATREEAIADGLDKYGGLPFWICRGFRPLASSYVPSSENIAEMMWDAARDEAGDAAEDFPELSDDKLHELDELLILWAADIVCPFWVSDEHPEKIVPAGAADTCDDNSLEDSDA